MKTTYGFAKMTSKIMIISLVLVSGFQVACSRSSFDAGLESSPRAVTPDDDTIVDVTKSSMTVGGEQIADGATAAEITLILRNINNHSLVNIQMVLEVSGSQNVVIPCTASDAQGHSHCRVYSTRAEVKTVRAIATVTLQTTMTFVDPNPSSSAFQIVSSAGDSEVSMSGPRLVATSGIVESDVQMRNAYGDVAVFSSILGSVLGE